MNESIECLDEGRLEVFPETACFKGEFLHGR